MPPLLVTGMARSGGSWVSRMLMVGDGLVHINEPLNRRHPPGLSPGILDVPTPVAYQYIGAHNDAQFGPGFADMLGLHYDVLAEMRANRGAYDLAKMIRYLTSFTIGRVRGFRPLVDDPYAVFAAEWLAERFGCQVVILVRHPAGVVSSLKRIGRGWSDNLPGIASQPQLISRYLTAFEDDIQRTVAAPFDVVEHACLLYRLIHSAIAQQAARRPEFVVVRYEDLAADPIAEFTRVYQRVGIALTDRAANTIAAATRAGGAGRHSPWGWVGLSKTAFQPMDSQANAHAWRQRLTAKEITTVLDRTRDVASLFYSPAELSPLGRDQSTTPR